MPIRDQETLKEYFSKGRRPTAGHYEDLIDSIYGAIGNINPDASYSATLFVDGGTEVTEGMRGSVNLPFNTIEAALNASQSGDLIIIFPFSGIYEAPNLYRGNINYYAFPGVIITPGDTTPILFDSGVSGDDDDDDEGEGETQFLGSATFKVSDRRFINLVNGGRLRINARDLTLDFTGGNLSPITTEINTTLYIESLWTTFITNGSLALINNSGELFIRGVVIRGIGLIGQLASANAIDGNGAVQIIDTLLTNLQPGQDVNFLSGNYELTNDLRDPGFTLDL